MHAARGHKPWSGPGSVVSATPEGASQAPTPPAAVQALAALERGNWRIAHDMAAQIGRAGPAVGYLALSMRERALGMVAESWHSLAAAAVSRPTGYLPNRRASEPCDQPALPWPAQMEGEFWRRFGLVGRREELQARSQWFRIEDSPHPKRACLIEACADHLTWVFFDRATWRAPHAGEWLPPWDRVTLGKLGETGREYFLRRANELLHWVHPLRGSITRKVWDDLGGYRGLHEAALAALAGLEDRRTLGTPHRDAYAIAIAWAREGG